MNLSELRDRIHVARFELVTAAARSAQSADLAGESTAESYDHWQGEIGRMIADLKAAHAEIGALRGHAHEWDDNDYCSVCGADGRA